MAKKKKIGERKKIEKKKRKNEISDTYRSFDDETLNSTKKIL